MRIPVRGMVVRLLRPLATPLIAAEYLRLLFRNRRAIAAADVVFPVWFWSFGHHATDPHLALLKNPGKKVLLLVSDYGDTNRHLVNSFAPHLSIAYMRHSRFARFLWTDLAGTVRTGSIKRGTLSFFLRITGARASVIDEIFERGPRVSGLYLVDYMRLLKERPDLRPVPPAESINQFRAVLQTGHADLANSWFVGIYLRKKYSARDDIRDAPMHSFTEAIAEITARGGKVFLGGDTDGISSFAGDGVYTYSDFDAPRDLADLYFLTQSRFVIGGHSGPLAVATAFDRPFLVTNCAFYYLSGYLATQRVIYKELRRSETREPIPADELFREPIVSFSEQAEFDAAGLTVVANSPGDVRAATVEMFELLDGHIAADTDLVDRYRSLLPRDSVAYNSDCRPAAVYLQNLKWQ